MAPPGGEGLSHARPPAGPLRTALSALTRLLVLPLAGRQVAGLDVRAVWARLRAAEMAPLLLAVAVFYGAPPLAGAAGQRRLQSPRRPLPSTAGVARIVYLARFARWITVERLAAAYRGHLRKGAAGVSFATSLGTLLAEQFLHLATLALLLAEGTRAPASGRAVTPPVQAG